MWDFIFSLIYRQSAEIIWPQHESSGRGCDDGMSVSFNGPFDFGAWE